MDNFCFAKGFASYNFLTD